MRVLDLAAAAAIVAHAPAARAQFTTNTDADDLRRLTTSATASWLLGDDTDADGATPAEPFGNWLDMIRSEAFSDPVRAVASAAQDSTFFSDRILATGDARAEVMSPVVLGEGVASARSDYTLRFSLGADQPVRFEAMMARIGSGQGIALLRRVGGPILQEFQSSGAVDLHLTPGVYQIEAFAFARVSVIDDRDALGSASFAASLTAIPAPATALAPALGLLVVARRRRA